MNQFLGLKKEIENAIKQIHVHVYRQKEKKTKTLLQLIKSENCKLWIFKKYGSQVRIEVII